MEDMHIGMSTEQLKDLKELARRTGIEVAYDIQMDKWTVNPAALMAAFCKVAEIPEDKGIELLGRAMGLIAVQTIIDDISKGLMPDE